MFPRNVGWLSTYYTTLYPRRQNSSTKAFVWEIWGSHGRDYEEYHLLGCEGMQVGGTVPKFRSNFLLASSGSKSKKQVTSRVLVVCLIFGPKDGGSTFLRKVSKPLPDYTASHHRRQYSLSYSFVYPQIPVVTTFCQENKITKLLLNFQVRRNLDSPNSQ
jgi:hypothetical protein